MQTRYNDLPYFRILSNELVALMLWSIVDSDSLGEEAGVPSRASSPAAAWACPGPSPRWRRSSPAPSSAPVWSHRCCQNRGPRPGEQMLWSSCMLVFRDLRGSQLFLLMTIVWNLRIKKIKVSRNRNRNKPKLKRSIEFEFDLSIMEWTSLPWYDEETINTSMRLSLMEPFPMTAHFVILCSWSLFMEFPFGPSSLPTKLNWNNSI